MTPADFPAEARAAQEEESARAPAAERELAAGVEPARDWQEAAQERAGRGAAVRAQGQVAGAERAREEEEAAAPRSIFPLKTTC